MIWAPLSKISVVESAEKSLIRSGATGFVVLQSEDAMGYRNYWTVDLVLTRNGKKGQRRIQYRRAKIRALKIEDELPKALSKLLTPEVLARNAIESDTRRGLDLITLEKEPYLSKNILEWDTWDFLGWLAAASQLCSFLSAPEETLHRIEVGMPLTKNPHTRSILFENGGNSYELTSIDPEFIIGILLNLPTKKSDMAAALSIFGDPEIRYTFIQKCFRTIASGQIAYKKMMGLLNSLEAEWRVSLIEIAKREANPNKDLGTRRSSYKSSRDSWRKYVVSTQPTIQNIPAAPTPTIMIEEDTVVLPVLDVEQAPAPTVSLNSNVNTTTTISGISPNSVSLEQDWEWLDFDPAEPSNSGDPNANNS